MSEVRYLEDEDTGAYYVVKSIDRVVLVDYDYEISKLYERRDLDNVYIEVQDDGRTLKVFVNTKGDVR